MAKKKTVKKKRHASSEKRHGSVSLKDMQACAADLDELTSTIQAAIASMKRLGDDEISIDGATKWDRGFELLHQYTNNLTKSLPHARAAPPGPDT